MIGQTNRQTEKQRLQLYIDIGRLSRYRDHMFKINDTPHKMSDLAGSVEYILLKVHLSV